MPPIDLPGFRYDTELGTYINLRTGRPVTLKQLQKIVDEKGDRDEKWLLALLLLLADGEIAPSVFAATATLQLQRLHLQNAALGAGGWDNLKQTDIDRIKRDANADIPRLLAMVTGVVAGKVSIAQARQRLQAYTGAARQQFYAAEQERAERPSTNMITITKRFLGMARHCEDCVRYYQMGWQLEGILPYPGLDSQCGGWCRCTITRRSIPAIDAPLWIGTRRSG